MARINPFIAVSLKSKLLEGYCKCMCPLGTVFLMPPGVAFALGLGPPSLLAAIFYIVPYWVLTPQCLIDVACFEGFTCSASFGTAFEVSSFNSAQLFHLNNTCQCQAGSIMRICVQMFTNLKHWCPLTWKFSITNPLKLFIPKTVPILLPPTICLCLRNCLAQLIS